MAAYIRVTYRDHPIEEPVRYEKDEAWTEFRDRICSALHIDPAEHDFFLNDTDADDADLEMRCMNMHEVCMKYFPCPYLDDFVLDVRIKLKLAVRVTYTRDHPTKAQFPYEMDDTWGALRGRICSALRIDPAEHHFVLNDTHAIDDILEMSMSQVLTEFTPTTGGFTSPMPVVQVVPKPAAALHVARTTPRPSAPYTTTQHFNVSCNGIDLVLNFDVRETWGVLIHRICSRYNILSTEYNFIWGDSVFERDSVMRRILVTEGLKNVAVTPREGTRGAVDRSQGRPSTGYVNWTENAARGAVGQVEYDMLVGTWGEVLESVTKVRASTGKASSFNLYKKVDGTYRLIVVPSTTRMTVVESIYGILEGLKLRREEKMEENTFEKARGWPKDTAWEERRDAILKLVEHRSALIAMEACTRTDDTKRAEVHEAIARLEAMAAERGNEERRDIKGALSTLRYKLTLLESAKKADKTRKRIDTLETVIAFLSSEAALRTDEEDLRLLVPLANEFDLLQERQLTTDDPLERVEAERRMAEIHELLAPMRAALKGRRRATQEARRRKRK